MPNHLNDLFQMFHLFDNCTNADKYEQNNYHSSESEVTN